MDRQSTAQIILLPFPNKPVSTATIFIVMERERERERERESEADMLEGGKAAGEGDKALGGGEEEE